MKRMRAITNMDKRIMRSTSIALRTISATVVIALIVGCSSAPGLADAESKTFLVSGLRTGLVSFSPQNGAFVSAEGSDFRYDDSGSCVAAGVRINCMWHGFEFDYHSPYERTVVNCMSRSNRKQNVVDPRAKRETDVTESAFSFEVFGRNGHYVRPQYTTNVVDTDFNTETDCTVQGRNVFSYRLNLTPAQ